MIDKLESMTTPRVICVKNGYEPNGPLILCSDIEEAKNKAIEVLKYQTVLAFGITPEQYETKFKEVEAQKKVQITVCELKEVEAMAPSITLTNGKETAKSRKEIAAAGKRKAEKKEKQVSLPPDESSGNPFEDE